MRALVIDGVEIPEGLLAQEAQNHPAATAAESRAAAGHALAIKALLLDRARELGLSPEPELDAAGREETGEEAMIRAVMEAEMEVATPDAAACRHIYETKPDSFHTPPLFEASHILIEVRDTDAETTAREMAQGAIATLGANQCSFAELASDLSDCPSGATGGSLGQLRPGDVVGEIETVLRGLAPGQVAAQPVRSRFGWHVLRLDRRIEGRQLPFEAVEDRIRMHLESRAWTAAAVRYTAGLVERARERGIALTLCEDGDVSDGSLTLGEMLSGGAAAAARLEPWLAKADPTLAENLGKAAADAGVPTPEFVQDAVAGFVAGADDDAWTQLVSAARDAEDPALAGLAALLRSKIEPPKRTFTIIQRT